MRTWSYSTDNGATWTAIETNLSTTTDPNGQNYGYGITGISSGWVDLTADLSGRAMCCSASATGPTPTPAVSASWWTTSASTALPPMAPRRTPVGPSSDRLHVTTGTEAALFNHYYVAEYRTYKGYDSTLKVGPYYFGYLNNPLSAISWITSPIRMAC